MLQHRPIDPTIRQSLAGAAVAIDTIDSAEKAAAGSRINADIQRILLIREALNNAINQVAAHAFALGYLTPQGTTGAGSAGKVEQISHTLQSSLGEVETAVQGLEDTLALFRK